MIKKTTENATELHIGVSLKLRCMMKESIEDIAHIGITYTHF